MMIEKGLVKCNASATWAEVQDVISKEGWALPAMQASTFSQSQGLYPLIYMDGTINLVHYLITYQLLHL